MFLAIFSMTGKKKTLQVRFGLVLIKTGKKNVCLRNCKSDRLRAKFTDANAAAPTARPSQESRRRMAPVNRKEGQSEAGDDHFHNHRSYALSVVNGFNSHVKLMQKTALITSS